MRRSALLSCAFVVFCLFQSIVLGQSLTGSWSGTYSAMFPAEPCGGGVLNFSGAMFAAFNQTGSSFNGVVTAVGFKDLEDTGPGTCQIVDLTITLLVSGTVSGSTVSGVISTEEGDVPVSATLTGDTLMGSAFIPGGSFSFSLTRFAQASVNVAGTWRGPHHITESCQTHTGEVTLILTQSGTLVSGSGSVTGIHFECNDPTVQTVDFSIDGLVVGNSFNAFLHPPAELALSTVVDGNTMTGTVTGIDVFGSVSLIRTDGAPSVTSFLASPDVIRLGQRATLSWTTINATAVSIDNGLGSQRPQGSVTVTPSATTTYTLTASGSEGTATAQVTVKVVAEADIRVSLLPSSLIQATNSGGATTRYALTNAGGAASNITLEQSGDFFTQSSTAFTLAPGASETVTIAGIGRSAGTFRGSITPRGGGVPAGLSIAVQLLSADRPSGAPQAVARTARVDVAVEAGGTPAGIAQFTNRGTGPVIALANADVPWLNVPADPIIIAPGATADVAFTVDRSRRPDADSPAGSVSGSLALTYLSGTGAAKVGSQQTGGDSSKSQLIVVDTARPSVSQSAIPPLQPGEIALFVPGIRSGADLGSDLSIYSPESISDLKLYYLPATGSAGQAFVASLAQVPVNQPLTVGNAVKSVFQRDNEVGTLILRASQLDKVLVNATLFRTIEAAGTHGLALPVFRSDRTLAPGGSLALTGLRGSGSSETDLYLQEASGAPATARIDFYNTAGVSIAARNEALAAFQFLHLPNVVPSGAVSAIVRNDATSGGRILAYATPLDRNSGDSWSVIDWRHQFAFAPSEAALVPVAGALRGRNNSQFQTDLALMNTATVSASGTLQYVEDNGQVLEHPMTLGAFQSNLIDNVVRSLFGIMTPTVGYLVYIPSTGAITMSSRTYTTGPQGETFGTGVPTVALSSSIRSGEIRRISGVEDATRETIVSATPATFRTNFGLLETTGQNATVRVTMHYTLVTGKQETRASASKDYQLTPRQFLLLNNAAAEILGAARQSSFGDLRSLQLDFQVLSESGSVSVFTSTVENRTNDSILRIE